MLPTSEHIFSIRNQDRFDELSLEIFRWQAQRNNVYGNYLRAIGFVPENISGRDQIPFLPISFFKTHNVECGDFIAEKIFASSGTTGANTSRHFVKDLSLYRDSLACGFKEFYGDPHQYAILALLPSYLERSDSSLVYMAGELMKVSAHPLNGFFLDKFEELSKRIELLEKQKQKTILIGVTFALLEFAKKFPCNLNHTIIMETGGMKGRREEITRYEVHALLSSSFGPNKIHSEYGMTELLSQAYSQGDGLFQCPPWMSVSIRDVTDPFCRLPAGRTGAINIIDLANVHSCAFIATDDLGSIRANGTFEVSGRYDHADVRGCNLLVP